MEQEQEERRTQQGHDDTDGDVADEPRLSAACTTAILSTDPDVKVLRDRIGAAIHQRMAAALGPDADPAVLRAFDVVYSGAMVHAGMGHLSYDELGDRLSEIATLLLDGAS